MCCNLAFVFSQQEDKDLVHEFVQNDGLACLIKVGSEADQNYQNYILRGEYLLVYRRIYGPDCPSVCNFGN
jgi:predicted naringenin-chalcone synthase